MSHQPYAGTAHDRGSVSALAASLTRAHHRVTTAVSALESGEDTDAATRALLLELRRLVAPLPSVARALQSDASGAEDAARHSLRAALTRARSQIGPVPDDCC